MDGPTDGRTDPLIEMCGFKREEEEKSHVIPMGGELKVILKEAKNPLFKKVFWRLKWSALFALESAILRRKIDTHADIGIKLTGKTVKNAVMGPITRELYSFKPLLLL